MTFFYYFFFFCALRVDLAAAQPGSSEGPSAALLLLLSCGAQGTLIFFVPDAGRRGCVRVISSLRANKLGATVLLLLPTTSVLPPLGINRPVFFMLARKTRHINSERRK